MLGWFLLVNGLIGIFMAFIGTFIFFMVLTKIFGEKIVDEAYEMVINESDDIYNAMTDHPEYLKALSMLLSVFLWEFTLPIVYYKFYTVTKDLYNTRKGDLGN